MSRDNNDINPESLHGVSLHCTNGIVIQLSRVALNLPESNPITTPSPIPKKRLKKYQAKEPYEFAYDRPNYARFLTYYWIDMQKLLEAHPAIHKQFEDGNFAVRRQHGNINKIPSDQAIEQTINRPQKCSGGITGFSTTEGTVQRWVLTSHIAAKCRSNIGVSWAVSSKKGDKRFGRKKGAIR